MNGTIITVDTNENMHHPEHKTKFSEMGALCNVKSLPYDFHIIAPDGATIGIERKSPHDYLESIKDRRLFNQGKNLVECVQWPYVVIDGGFFYVDRHGYACYRTGDENYDTETIDGIPAKSTKWSMPSLQGSLISLQEMGIAVVYDPDFHGAVKRIVNRSRDDVKIAPRRDSYVFTSQEATLMTLPGVGAKKAQEYLKQFGTLLDSILSLAEPTIAKDLKGWGEKSALNLREFLGYGEKNE